MKLILIWFSCLCVLDFTLCESTGQVSETNLYHERYRPQYHYSPPRNWMNDPNGLVKYNDDYHLFFQHNPKANTPDNNMHWGHAVSKDLLRWETLPVAIYPDNLGVIYSGSAVVDERNSSGLQATTANKVLVAIYTSHATSPTGLRIESQSVSYSNDAGLTWEAYSGNPVIVSRGQGEHTRDPKVMPYGDGFILTLVAYDRVLFYGSQDLLHWTKLSEFGTELTYKRLIWECPDLVRIQDGNQTVWVLIISLLFDGINGGTGTMYFVGQFDGTKFTNANSNDTLLWLDYGPDCYAGVTWTNTNTFICWMSNWLYAKSVPTSPWRSHMSLPRHLNVETVNNRQYVTLMPLNVDKLRVKDTTQHRHFKSFNVSTNTTAVTLMNTQQFELHFEMDIQNLTSDDTFEFCLFNNLTEKICIKFIKSNNSFLLDRSRAGNVTFDSNFMHFATAPRISKSKSMTLLLLVDVSSLELFADNGLTLMSSVFYFTEDIAGYSLKLHSNSSSSTLIFNGGHLYPLTSVWTKSINAL